MLSIPCPWCGPREEPEFTYGGEAHVARPAHDVDDAGWARYLFQRENPKGTHHERWCHTQGCGQWFNAARDARVADRGVNHPGYRSGNFGLRLARSSP